MGVRLLKIRLAPSLPSCFLRLCIIYNVIVALGFAIVLITRSLGKIIFRSIVSNTYYLIGAKAVIRGKGHYFNTTYNEAFKIPPVFNTVRLS